MMAEAEAEAEAEKDCLPPQDGSHSQMISAIRQVAIRWESTIEQFTLSLDEQVK